MIKVMTRLPAHRRAGAGARPAAALTGPGRRGSTRPPGRHDTRRPGGTPVRTTTRTGPQTTPGSPAPGGPPPAPAGTRRTTDAPGAGRPTDVFADKLLAVLSGQRPVHWMLRHTAGQAYDDLAWLAERSPLRARGSRPVVLDIGFFVPREGAVEAFARIGAGERLSALAFRLELGRDQRWRCTAVELGGPALRRPPESVG
ncbi:Rv3235 family protein [Streptomyces sp. TS71-3]|uniref:Rv3235 family protein n=1 Tax=Streptomyces sp. TS71-3 TaxID=2733862 RepID=UPI001BB344B8|nr:Rv3235 family protein [Streptomyces sp. TS71-3]